MVTAGCGPASPSGVNSQPRRVSPASTSNSIFVRRILRTPIRASILWGLPARRAAFTLPFPSTRRTGRESPRAALRQAGQQRLSPGARNVRGALGIYQAEVYGVPTGDHLPL